MRKNKKGFALVEALLFLVAFSVLTVYSIDFFAVIQTALVNNIHARTYLFETLQHRSDISLLRQDDPSSRSNNYGNPQNDFMRFHAVNDENQPMTDDKIRPSARRLTRVTETIEGQMKSDKLDSNDNKASVIHVKSGYGICISSSCGAGG